MSQFQHALSYTLTWEDPELKYEPVPDPGGFAIAGVNSHDWPSEYAEIAQSPVSKRYELVFNFYQKNFWNPARIGGLNYQDVANRVFDESVNSGLITGVKILQKAINACGVNIAVDGFIGSYTMDAANHLDSERLVASLRNQRLLFYKNLLDNNSLDAKYFTNWQKRALA